MEPVVAQTGNCMHVTDLMREGIEKAGFINIHERVFKFLIGDWPKHPIYKEAGRLHMKSYKDGSLPPSLSANSEAKCTFPSAYSLKSAPRPVVSRAAP